MNIEKLEKLNELKEKGYLTQEEFEEEKAKLLKEKHTKAKKSQSESVESRLYDYWHDHGMATVICVIILFFVIYMLSHEMAPGEYIILFAISWLLGWFFKEYQKMSKDIKDLHRYSNIKDVIAKYGTPDDVKEYDEYKKYTFKQSTKGWTKFKYQVDIFTLQNDKIIKHENFYE